MPEFPLEFLVRHESHRGQFVLYIAETPESLWQEIACIDWEEIIEAKSDGMSWAKARIFNEGCRDYTLYGPENETLTVRSELD